MNALACALAKLRCRVLLLLTVCYAVNQLDRGNLTMAAMQMSLPSELNLSREDFGLAAGLFFVSYAMLQVPLNALTARLGAHRTLGAMMVAWGAVSAACGMVTEFGSLLVLRVLLGLAESGFYPGCILLVSRTFPANAQTEAMGWFSVGGAVLGGVLSIGNGAIMDLTDGWLGLSGWRWLFLLEGAPAPLLGLIIYATLPAKPAKARWLTAAEREALQGAMPAAEEQLPPLLSVVRQLACMPTSWLLVCMNFACQVLIYAQAFFNALVWRSLVPRWPLWRAGPGSGSPPSRRRRWGTSSR